MITLENRSIERVFAIIYKSKSCLTFGLGSMPAVSTSWIFWPLYTQYEEIGSLVVPGVESAITLSSKEIYIIFTS